MAFFARPQSAAVRIVNPNTQDLVLSSNKGLFLPFSFISIPTLDIGRFCTTTMQERHDSRV
jgi:hypothetical protein